MALVSSHLRPDLVLRLGIGTAILAHAVSVAAEEAPARRDDPVATGSNHADVEQTNSSASQLDAPKGGGEAVVPPVASDLPRVDITETTSVIYNFDNRNTQPDKLASYSDDRWGLWSNRLNLQTSWKGLRAGLRADTVYFYTYPSPQYVGLRMLKDRPAGGSASDAEYFQSRTLTAGDQLINRYIHWTYPSKYYLEFASRHADVSIGDFYSQLGRGLVLSLRKMDELASDTTVRGARLVVRTGDIGGVSVDASILGGELNPLRVDEPSGRYLSVTRAVAPGWLTLTEAGMPYAITSNLVRTRIPTYAPDEVAAGQVLVGLPLFGQVVPTVKFGTQASYLVRQDALSSRGDATLSQDGQQILTASQSLELPNIASKADVYFEAASQQLRSNTVRDRDGFALYGTFGLRPKPLSITFEGKHYRRFSPLRANVSTQYASEFMTLQYNAPPNTLPTWADYEGGTYNVCATGGRAKVDWAALDGVTVFGWLGRYASWSEATVNPYCDQSRDNRTQAWDSAVGMEVAWNQHRSHANWTVGGRDDKADAALPAVPSTDDVASERTRRTHKFYREVYGRYDLVVSLSSDYALQLQGLHRRRDKPLLLSDPWYEGIHTTGLQLFGKLTTAVGVEYTMEPAFPPFYLNFLVQWRVTPASSLALFVGQRRGAIRCVGGMCRNYPPFEGARFDATVRW